MLAGCAGTQPSGPQRGVQGGIEEAAGDVQCSHEGRRKKESERLVSYILFVTYICYFSCNRSSLFM